MYANGQGVPQNYSEAMKWYRLAADQGNAAAQTALGVVYASGLGVPQDQAKAVEWTRKAADQGYANAQNNLGNMYARGGACRRITARQGYASAQNNLVMMYNSGRGVQQNYAEGIKWSRLAAEQGLAAALCCGDYAAPLQWKLGCSKFRLTMSPR
jgi:uncharacterized protein